VNNLKSIPVLSCLLILLVKIFVPKHAQCLVVIARLTDVLKINVELRQISKFQEHYISP
jgi:hypothetical protein